MLKYLDLTVKDFANIFNVDIIDMPQSCIDMISSKDFRYCHLDREERDEIILNIIKKVDLKLFSTSGVDCIERWEKGWKEIVDNFVNSGYSIDSLIPQYNKRGTPMWLFGDFVKPCDDNFENNFIELMRLFIFEKYLKDKNNIYEFGCGSCYHLLSWANRCPDKNYYGYDWASQSVEIIDKIREQFKLNIYGETFDMFFPNNDLDIKEDSVMVAIGSLEQIGSNFNKFMDLFQ